ncbi:MAG: tail fiber domain-containing protein, partial [Flavobacteriales bacterium]|nr:tail fiber domain-containing protein [Flavobacteriales bacterium]
MKNCKFLGCIVALTVSLHASSQDWTLAGNPISGGEWFGADGSSTVPLQIRHDGNYPIEWYTNNTRRMRLSGSFTGQTVNGYTGIDLSGNLGVGTMGNSLTTAPLAMIQLSRESLIPAGFRPWMYTGMLCNYTSDMAYFGTKVLAGDRLNAVVSWGDNSTTNFSFGPDALQFIFTEPPNTTTSAGSIDGLEIARMIPAANGNEGFFGLGDWFAAGGNINPTERLDLLDGRVRIRQLPDDDAATDSLYIMVVDRTLGTERGVVKWIDPSDLPSADCDWVVQSPIPQVSTVYDGSSCSWNMKNGVGIGVQDPKAKLDVRHLNADLLELIGIRSQTFFEPEDLLFIQGILGEAGSTSETSEIFPLNSTGVTGRAYNSKASTGVAGIADLSQATSGTAGAAIGVSGTALANELLSTSDWCVGVYGYAKGANNSNSWAGWFDGQIIATAYQPSDETLKTDIEEITNAAEIIAQLRPKRYAYRTEQYESMSLPNGEQYGFLAGEIAEVLPSIVANAARGEELDTLGNVISDRIEFQAINYTGLIPYLVSGMQEQQATIAAQNERLDQLESMLLDCCNRGTPDGDQLLEQEQVLLNGRSNERSMQVVPNPFRTETTIHYNLERGGRVQLMANSADGKQLRVL